jgi:hypothetical protein
MRPLRLTTWMFLSVALTMCGAVSVFSQQVEVQRLSLNNFSGINTAASPLTIKPNEMLKANNILLSNPDGNVGSMSKRLGYDSVSALGQWYDSLVGIFGVGISDGKKYLAYVADSVGVGYGGVYATHYGSHILDSAIWHWHIWFGSAPPNKLTTYWNCQSPTSFAMFKDILYAVNGVQKGIYYDGTVTRSYPLAAPGEPKIVPMAMPGDPNPLAPDTNLVNYYDTTQWKFSGEYRYVCRAYVYGRAGSDTGKSWLDIPWGPISSPVRVTNGRVLLTDFQYVNPDTLVDTVDSVQIQVYRTKVNPAPLKLSTWFYRVGYGDTLSLRGASMAGLVFIDSIPDSLLTTDSITVDSLSERLGVDSLTTTYYHRYGAPGYLASITSSFRDTGGIISGNPIDSLSKGGIFFGIPMQKDTLGVVYVTSLMDTVNGQEGDTGRALVVVNDSIAADSGRYRRWITLSIPKKPSGLTGTVTNLYRAHLLQIGHDSSLVNSQLMKKLNDIFKGKLDLTPFEELGTPFGAIWKAGFAPDTVVLTPFYLVAQIADTQTTYTDSLRFDSLYMFHQPYRQRTPSVNFSQIGVFDGALYGLNGSRLYRSKKDSTGDGYSPTFRRWIAAMAMKERRSGRVVLRFAT